MADIDSLNIAINATNRSAEAAIGSLVNTMGRLRGAVESVVPESAIGRLHALSDTIKGLAESGGMEGLAANFTRLNNAVSQISQTTVAKLQDIASAVQQMNGATVSFKGIGASAKNMAVAPDVKESLWETAEATKELAASERDAASAGGSLRYSLKTFWKDTATGLNGTIVRLTSSFTGLLAQMRRVATMRALRWVIREIVKGIKEGITNLYHWSAAVDKHFMQKMDQIATSMQYLKNSFGALFGGIIEQLAPIIDYVVDKVVDLLNWFNQLFAALSGADTYTAAKKIATTWDDTSKDVKKNASDTAKEIKKTILGFDEINKLTKPTSASSSSSSSDGKKTPDYKNMFETLPVSGGFTGLSDAMKTALEGSLSSITKILGFAPLALGAVLVLSGANVPVGLGLMAEGAVTLGIVASNTWEGMKPEVKQALAALEAIVIGAELAVGAVLAFSTANVPLGVALMASGALSLGLAANLQWGTLINGSTGNALNNLASIVSGALLAVGAVLAFTSINLPVGIGMMAAGITGLAVSLNWGQLINASMSNTLKNTATIVSAASLAIGALLAFTNVNVPLGVMLIGAGMVGTAGSIIWGGGLTGPMSNVLKNIAIIVGEASIALGSILTFTGHPTIGIPLMAAGALTLYGEKAIDWDYLVEKLRGPLGVVVDLVSAASLALGILLVLNPVTLPLGIGLLFAGAAGLATSMAANWDSIKTIGKRALEKVKEGWDSVKTGAFTFVAKVRDTSKKWWENVKGWWAEKTESGDPLKSIVIDVANTAGNWWADILDWWGKASDYLTVNVKPVLMTVGGKIADAATSFWNWLFPTAYAEEDFGNIDITLGVNDTDAQGWLKTFQETAESVESSVRKTWNNISSWSTSTWDTVSETVGGRWDDITTAAKRGVDNVGSWVSETWTNLKSDTSTTWENVKQSAVNAWLNMQSNATSLFGSIKSNVAAAWSQNGGVQGVLGSFISWVNNTFAIDWEGAWTTIVDGFSDVFGKIVDAAKVPINKVIGFFNTMIGAVEKAINAIINGINDRLKFNWKWDLPWPFNKTITVDFDPGLSTVKFNRIQELATGGILDGATLLGMANGRGIVGGEAGQEAVLPLESHTEWMNTLADRINERDSSARRADEQMIALMRSLLSEMRQLNEKDMNVSISTMEINRAQKRSNLRAGTTVAPVGV